MIKPPSLIHEFSLVYSEDPALDLPSDPAERERALKVARETGKWPIREGQQPTMFHFRDLTREAIGWWRGECGHSTALGRPLSDVEFNDLLVRIALRGIDNFGSLKVERKQVSKGIHLVNRDVIEAIYEAAPRALGEFFDVIFVRMGERLRPLS